MVKFVDRVKMNLTTTGTGTVTFGSVVSGFQSLSDASVVDSDVVRYTIESGTNYEVGTGTIGLTGSTYTMARSPSSSSESDNSAINLGAGAVCFLTMLAEDVVQNLADLDNVSSTLPAGGQNLSWDAGAGSWVPASPSGGITSVGNYAGLPASPNETDLAWVQDQKALYVFDGTEWDRFYTDTNATPDWTTEPPSNANLAVDGTATVQTVVASDPEGFPIEYSYDTNPSNQTQATISQSNNVFTITPSTTESDAGVFTLRYGASDGIHSTSKSTIYTLEFTTPMNVSTSGSGSRMDINANSTTGALDISAKVGTSQSVGVGYVPTTGLKLGKYYIELDITSSLASPNNILMFGIGDLAMAQAGTLGYNTGGNVQISLYANTPRFYPYSGTPPNFGTLDDGNLHTIMIAYDTTAERVWFGVDGTWDTSTNTGGAPGTGAGIDISGVNFTTGLTFTYGSATGAGSATAQFVSGTGQTLTYAVPTGFDAY